jgi:hypothetical protein
MKTLEKIMKGMTWAAWAAFVYGIVRMEKPTGASIICLVVAATWIITAALVKEEIGGER